MCASCTAAEPMPLPTELTSTVSPASRPPRVKSMCHAVANAICDGRRLEIGQLVRNADELGGGAGELLGVASGMDEADEAGVETQGLPARRAEARTGRTCPSGTASRGRRPATPRPRRRARRSVRPPRRPRTCGGSIGKREIPSRTSTSRWFSAQAATSTVTSPGPGLGSSSSSSRRTSELPNSRNTTAFTSCSSLRGGRSPCLCLTSATMSNLMSLATARSLLFAPGNDEHRLEKALAAGADVVVADLEDAVPDGEKERGP